MVIYVGVNDDGSISGVSSVDETMKELREIIRDQILLDTKNLVDIDCLREVVYNALAHNDWLSGGVPSVYVYKDRIEVISYGGLPFGKQKKISIKALVNLEVKQSLEF